MGKIHDVIIIGAGLSGLSVAHFLTKIQPGLDLLLLEKNARPGGAVRSFQAEGFLAEWGPHGFLNNTPESLEILRDTGLINEVQQAPLGNFVRFVCHKGKLVQLPQNPKSLLLTPLLSLKDKLRILGDLFIKAQAEDQTIGEWAGRRFGKGVLHLIDAAVTGTFAGDYNRLSINSVMPGLRRLEMEAGSILRGLKKKKKLAASPAKELPAMLNFPQGMERLTEKLSSDKPIYYNISVERIEAQDGIWQIKNNEKAYLSRKLVVALPVNQSLELLAGLREPPMQSVPVAKIVNVVMGFGESAKIPRGFGYLAPENERRFVMGAMFSSYMFPDRAPEGNTLIEVLVGGRRHPERLQMNDEEITQKAYEDIGQLMTLPDKPWFTKALRPEGGIPQLEMGHPALLEWQNELVREQAGLYICGFGWSGIGINDMTKSAKKTAEAVIAGGDARLEEKAGIKPVYF